MKELPSSLIFCYQRIKEKVSGLKWVTSLVGEWPEQVKWWMGRKEYFGGGKESVEGYKLLFQKEESREKRIRKSWSSFMEEEVEQQTWRDCVQRVYLVVKAIRFRIFEWKCLHKNCYIPGRIVKFFSVASEKCWRCPQKGDWKHILWECEELGEVRERIRKFLEWLRGPRQGVNQMEYWMGVHQWKCRKWTQKRN